MKAFALKDKDIVLENNRIKLIEGEDALRQRILNKVSMFKGEWFLLPDEGIDWLGILGRKFVNDREMQIELESVLSSDAEVNTINYIDIAFDNEAREVIISFSLNTIYGEVNLAV